MTDVLERLTTALGDRYAIARAIGAGGMAAVYLAEDRRHHREVAGRLPRPGEPAMPGDGHADQAADA